MEKKNYQMHGQASQDSFSLNEMQIYTVRRETNDERNDLKTRQYMARYVEANA